MAVLTAALVGSVLPGSVKPALAKCVSSGSTTTCVGSDGSTYSMTRTGDGYYSSGTNPSTGSTWSTSTQRFGGVTVTHEQYNTQTWDSVNSDFGGGMSVSSTTDYLGKTSTSTCAPLMGLFW